KSISKVIVAAAVDDTRYTLNGIFTVLSADSIIMVATDAHRLALSEIKDKLKNVDGETNFIIPRKGAQEIMNLLKEVDSKEGSKLLFKAEQNNIFFRIGDKLLVSRVIEGKYPQYEKVIPKGNDIEMIFNKEALKQVLNRIDLVASEKSHAVIFSFDKSHVKMYSSSPEFGEGEEKLEINYGGEEFKIAFNARYLIDFLSSANTENVIMKLKDSNTAGMLREEKNEDYIYIVSPIKL
ncbi:MAG: DNA polymerase III subunit beta, partial [Acidobacteria bacterium]|nr:DNA polymerase III subunit beta [Acidobacteriota bacterium]